MSLKEGFYNIVTDGTSFYASNTSRDVVCKITQTGAIDYYFIVVDSPLCLAITRETNPSKKNRMFILTNQYIFVYQFDTPDTVSQIRRIRYNACLTFPALFYNSLDDKLYISDYEKGIIRTLDANYVYTDVYTNPQIKGISGMVIASNILYFSNYDMNYIFFIDNGIVRPYLTIYSPRGLHYASSNFYICYGRGTQNGIVVNNYGTTNYTNVFSDFLFNSIPLNTLLFSGSLYITLDNSNVIYKNKTAFSSANFIRSVIYNAPNITQSVIGTNPKCVENPAFRGLIQLRTYGSNPNNPITPITTLVGRLQGNQIPFNVGLGSDYESLKMRRKAETLKFRNSKNNPGVELSTKQLFTNIVKNGGAYHFSRTRLLQLLKANNGNLPCDIGVNNGNPITVTPPSNSGINDSTFEGYYLNPYVPYFASL
jgi:hypothetical protein